MGERERFEIVVNRKGGTGWLSTSNLCFGKINTNCTELRDLL